MRSKDQYLRKAVEVTDVQPGAGEMHCNSQEKSPVMVMNENRIALVGEGCLHLGHNLITRFKKSMLKAMP